MGDEEAWEKCTTIKRIRTPNKIVRVLVFEGFVICQLKIAYFMRLSVVAGFGGIDDLLLLLLFRGTFDVLLSFFFAVLLLGIVGSTSFFFGFSVTSCITTLPALFAISIEARRCSHN